jgi:signal transduction histidine kinase/ligand-binding sensor domain-containing protein/CheY-like chemotaxis protein/HPt (histidine-containing phosphotransfer) domain-containing protein
MLRSLRKLNKIAAFLCFALIIFILWGESALAGEQKGGGIASKRSVDSINAVSAGGGYAATGQSGSVGYTSILYDETNGLVTSDANYILSDKKGYIWVGNYSGVFRYDGTVFDKIDYSEGLTSARGLFEDSKGRIWVGTNDNGVVVIEGEKATWLTYKEGLLTSSIRVFAEDHDGNVFIGTTEGLCYADPELKIQNVDDERLNGERILRLIRSRDGTIYGSTKEGKVFSIKNGKIHQFFESSDLGIGKITTILPDPENSNYVYFGTNDNVLYYGRFGNRTNGMKKIPANPLQDIHWMTYECGRIWVASTSKVGYLDGNNKFHLLNNLAMNSGIEMMTSDYQGNIWFASSNQGVMKIVSTNFVDYSVKVGIPKEPTNSVCKIGNILYVGTDNGLYIVVNEKPLDNALTKYIANARVRCLMQDRMGNLWISTFTNGLGLVCYERSGKITNYTMFEGLPSNEVRCTLETMDGSIYVGTNQGLVVIKDGVVTRIAEEGSEINNAVILTLEESASGVVMAGTDGDGLFVIEKGQIKRIGREHGLTSDVVTRVKNDNQENITWIITSNSIEYLRNGVISPVSSFPYNNNYDLCFDNNDNVWVLSPYGVCMVNREQMLNNEVNDYRIFSLANGVVSTPTSYSYNVVDDKGILYISGRHGVSKVDLDHFFEEKLDMRATLKSVYCGDEKIIPDEQGRYVLPPGDTRVRINTAVLDYTLVDPYVHVFMEGNEDDAALVTRSNLTAMEYTGMKHGNYNLHIQVLAGTNTQAIVDETYVIVKQPKISELIWFRIMGFVLIAAITGLGVWLVMKSTVIRKQYDQIKQARDDAERANTAKTRFLANISHEIRTPINTIMGMDEMIMREDATNVPKGYFMSMMNYAFDIKNATESLLGLINDLLDISKIESGKMHLVEQEYDVAELLRSIVSMIRVKSTEKELIFDVVVDEIMPVKLYGDAGKIKQIVLNLLTNAVKYTEKGGFVLSVSLNERNNDLAGISFSVKDTGIGVKAEDMDKLFTAYERLDEQKNSAIQGTGLGLDISRRFAELLGGSLTCESVYGEGSEFILAIKQKIVDETPIGVFMEHDDSNAKGPYVPQFIAPDADVLVVDDNPMNLNVIKGLLKATKIFVTTAGGGEECLEKMKTTRFNVVLLDHMMPGMDGIETVAKIRETDTEIPVYALTANTSVGEDFYLSKGFTGYLTKPIDTESLEKAILKHLPEEIVFKPEKEDAVPELETMPEDLGWINETQGISVEEGIKNSGGISSFIFSLKLFLDTIDGNSKVISDAYEADDIRLYTIKVHALKSSARIIGAQELSKLAASLEDAGNKHDKEFIDLHTDELLSIYNSYKEKLAPLGEEEQAPQENKKEISADELKDAYGALKDVIPQMDYDSVDLILKEIKEYSLPKEDAEIFAELGRLLKTFDWEAMETLIEEK